MDPYGLSGSRAYENPYGIGVARRALDLAADMRRDTMPAVMPPAIPKPIPQDAVQPLVVPPMMMPAGQPAMRAPAAVTSRNVFSPGGVLGPIGGAKGVGDSVPAPTVIPFKPSGPARAPIVGKDIPLSTLVAIQRKAESSGNYTALNREKRGNTASGAYQYTDSTWNNYGGYPKAMLAPKEVQDRRFAEDIARRVTRYNGDVFRAVADHFLPAFADKPHLWDKPQKIRLKGGATTTVKPVANYLRHVFRGTPYEGQIDAYIAAHQQ